MSTIEELIKISENKISLFKGEIAFHEKQIRLLQNEKKL